MKLYRVLRKAPFEIDDLVFVLSLVQKLDFDRHAVSMNLELIFYVDQTLGEVAAITAEHCEPFLKYFVGFERHLIFFRKFVLLMSVVILTFDLKKVRKKERGQQSALGC